MAKRSGEAQQLEFPPPWWRFSAWQREVWDATRELALPSTVLLVAGRGAGKDIVAMRCILRDALRLYAAKKGGLSDGLVMNPLVKIWVVGPQENNLKQAWDDWLGELRALAAWWGEPLGHAPHEHEWLWREISRENKIILFGKGEIEFEQRLTKAKGALRGPGVDFVHFTEFGMEPTPGQCERAWRAELPGTITRAGRLGRCYLTTTPYGPKGVLHELAAEACGGKKQVAEVVNAGAMAEGGRLLYRHAEWSENEFLTAEQRAQIESERSMGWIFEQERLARFVQADAGGMRLYEREWIERAYRTRPPEKPPRNVLVGTDLARLGDDALVFAVIDEDEAEVLRMEVHPSSTGPEIVAHMERIHREFAPGGARVEFMMDQTAHQGFVADFLPPGIRATGLKIYEREKERQALNLGQLLERGLLGIPHPALYPFASERDRRGAEVLVEELLMYSRIVGQGGRARYAAPGQQHDDAVTALMIGADPIARSVVGRADGEKAVQAVSELIWG